MSVNRAPRGLPLPSLGQVLVLIAAASAVWLIWSELRGPQSEAGLSGAGDAAAEEDAREAALENLRAVEAIARDGAEGVPELVEGLASANPRLRRNALLALRQIGPEAREALDPIRERLADEDAQTRAYAIDAYWSIRRDPDDVAAVAAPLLCDPDDYVRETAAKVLEIIGKPAIGHVVELLEQGAPAGRVPALNVLRHIGWDSSQPQIDESLRALAGDSEGDLHLEVLFTLAFWGRPAPAEIRELLRHPEPADSMNRSPLTEPRLHETALRAIIRLGADAAENLDDVLALFGGEHDLADQTDPARRNALVAWWAERRLALTVLESMGTAARPAVPRLVELFQKGRDPVRIDFAWTLLAIGADPQDVARLVTPLLLDHDTDTCFHAGRLLAQTSSPDARRQVSVLIPKLTAERMAGDGPGALDAVWGLAPEAAEAVPALYGLLESNERHVARIAAKTLGDIGPAAAPAIPALLAQLARGTSAHDYWARSAFCEALGKLGPAARRAVPGLLMELNDAPLEKPTYDLDRRGQRPVVETMAALARIGDAGSDVIAAIRRHLSNEAEHVQLAALQALARLDPDSPVVLADHLNWLNGPVMSGRLDVILAIGRLRGDRRAAVPALARLLSSSDPNFRKAAARSLGKMGPAASGALPDLQAALNVRENSQYAFHKRRYPPIPTAGDRRSRIETARWHDLESPLTSEQRDLRFQEQSVVEFVREAIAEIEPQRQP